MVEVVDEGTFDPAEFGDELARAAGNLAVGTRLWFQNDRVKVWEVRLEPGSGPFHAHTRRYLWTVVSPGTAGSGRPTAASRSGATRSATPSTRSTRRPTP